MAAKSPDLYFVRFAGSLGFHYVEADGITPLQVDWGQVVHLVEARNNEGLIKFKHLVKLEGTPRLAECGVCGQKFINDQTRDEHGSKRHRRSWDVDAVGQAAHGYIDTLGDGDEARIAALSPLDMSKSKAAQKG